MKQADIPVETMVAATSTVPYSKHISRLINHLLSQSMHRVALLVAGLSFGVPASAYLDPGAGNVLFQSIVGALAFGAAAVGAYFGRIRDFLIRRKNSKASKYVNDGSQVDGADEK